MQPVAPAEPSPGALLWLALFLALFVGVLLLSWWLRQKRREQFRQLVAQWGWSLTSDQSIVTRAGWYFLKAPNLYRILDIAVAPEVDGGTGPYAAGMPMWQTGKDRLWYRIVLARLPRPVAAPVLFDSWPGAVPGPFRRLFERLWYRRGHNVPVSDERIARRWGVYAEDVEAARQAVESDEELRDVVAAIQPLPRELGGPAQPETGWTIPRPNVRRPETLLIEVRGDELLVGVRDFTGRSVGETGELYRFAWDIVRQFRRGPGQILVPLAVQERPLAQPNRIPRIAFLIAGILTLALSLMPWTRPVGALFGVGLVAAGGIAGIWAGVRRRAWPRGVAIVVGATAVLLAVLVGSRLVSAFW